MDDFTEMFATNFFDQWVKEVHYSEEKREEYQQDFFESLMANISENHHNESRRGLSPLEIKSKQMHDFLSISEEYSKVNINDETIYLYDLSNDESTPFQTIIFQLNHIPIKTKEPSTHIMNRYFKKSGVKYDLVRLLGKCIDINDQCPYVVGEKSFVPEQDISSGDTNWFALHHVLNFEMQSSSATSLYFRNHHKVDIEMCEVRFLEQVHRVVNLYRMQQMTACTILGYFDYIKKPLINKEENIIHRYLQKDPCSLPPYSFEEITEFWNYFNTQDLVTKLSGVDNPYIDVVLSKYKKPPFLFEIEGK